MSHTLSRRKFLRTSAGGIAASWGGLQIFASRDAFARPTDSDRQKVAETFFVYGTHFYRPSNPPRAERRGMLREIAETYKFNTVRIYTPWVYLNPDRDRFNFTELDEVMGYCDEFGLKVLMGVVLEEAPYWLEAAHPESRYVNANDQAQRLGDSGNNVTGGWPGLCLDWQPVRDAAAKFIREMVKVVSAHPSLYAYDCWNEPQIEPTWGRHFAETAEPVENSVYCYCPRTIAQFQVWLQKRYGTIDRLNDAWVKKYPSWSLIDPPRHQGTYLDWIDWRRFMIERSTDELRFRVEQIRAVDSRGLLECHASMLAGVDAIATRGINQWRLAELVDIWGLSNFPRWNETPTYWTTARLELTRCQAAGKPFWITELQGGHGNSGLFRSRNMRPRDIRLWNWMGVATGAKGIIYWTYDTEATGTESSGFGLVARDGSPTERVLEAAEDHRLIRAHWDIIENYRPKPEVAFLYDQDCALLTFAMSGNETASTDSFSGYYKALWSCDLWVDFIEPQGLAGNRYKVIVAPWHLIGKKETCDQLRRYAEAGGTVVLETGFGMYDEHTTFNPVIPPFGLDEAFGYREGESFYLPEADSGPMPGSGRPTSKIEGVPASDRVYIDGHLDFTDPIAVTVKAHTFLTPLTVGTATVIATYGSTPVATRKKVGLGQVYYIGTNLGASIQKGDQGGLDLMRAILAGVVAPAVTADKVRPRLVEGAGRSLLAVFNDGAEDQTSAIKIPPRYQRATDLYGKETQIVRDNSVSVTVPYEGVSVMLLE